MEEGRLKKIPGCKFWCFSSSWLKVTFHFFFIFKIFFLKASSQIGQLFIRFISHTLCFSVLSKFPIFLGNHAHIVKRINGGNPLSFFIPPKMILCNDQCGLSRWPKFEHIEGSTDFFPSKPNFLQFVWISTNKICWKINIFHTLALKIVKYTLLNLTCQRLSKNTKNARKFSIKFSVLVFYLIFIQKTIK